MTSQIVNTFSPLFARRHPAVAGSKYLNPTLHSVSGVWDRDQTDSCSPSAETTVSISARLCAGASRTPELAICARWRANAFSVLKASFEEELRSLELFASDQSHGVALAAKADAEPIGTCLLVESEIEPNRDVSSWLAGLFLVPEHRRRGAGAGLVRAIEDQAATASCLSLLLSRGSFSATHQHRRFCVCQHLVCHTAENNCG